ncbi:unnamed protein product [marine sediment metagenome]|uniref:Uncharacterized protein n=1 Tax=marine sediment metagenome TaxID=412755 RepID=X1N8V5_9ZZZZ
MHDETNSAKYGEASEETGGTIGKGCYESTVGHVCFPGDKAAIGKHPRHSQGKGKGNLTKGTKPDLRIS